MKKNDLAMLAMIGISAGLMMGGCEKNNHPDRNKASAAEQMSPDMQSFYNSLTSDAQKKFMQLDAQHKMMAVEMAHQGCKGQNKCAGMGGCGNADHKCAAQNSCKGQGGAPVKDASKAVEAQYNNQMGQRKNTNGGMGGSSNYSGPGNNSNYSGQSNNSNYSNSSPSQPNQYGNDSSVPPRF